MGKAFSCCKLVPDAKSKVRVTRHEDTQKTKKGKNHHEPSNSCKYSITPVISADLKETLTTTKPPSVKMDSEYPVLKDQVSTQEQQIFNVPQRIILHTYTKKILKCLADFPCRRCFQLYHLSPIDVVEWITSIDRQLLLQGWQGQGFLTSGTVVFLYMLCRDVISSEIKSEKELQATLLTCLYVSYCYMGHQISYPLGPFLVDGRKETFWYQCLSIIAHVSSKMMRLNTDPKYYSQMFVSLRAEGRQANENLLMSGLPGMMAREESSHGSYYTLYL
ncbi:cyclin-dependent kinase 5 activator 1-like [Rhinoderma darwinii]|uniref:cyclin-dependent kinase 5 activator 1-like n=1 Tax=Rhinoderma darwinii TaxID=43563 RepID=UPI003F67CC4F